MSPDKLDRMANQIGTFFSAQRGSGASKLIAEHIRKFWEPRMRDQMFANIDAGTAHLDPSVRKAFELLRAERQPVA